MFKKFVTFVVILFIIFFGLIFGIGFYLSPQDKLEKADAVVVISGGDTNLRIDEGVLIYKDQFAPKIIFSGAAAEGNVSNAMAMRNIAIKEGVSAEDIFIEEKSKITEENAKYSAEIIRANEIKSIILVTSPYHQRRAYTLFRQELGENVKIINHSAKDNDWRKANWWSTEKSRFLTIGEILKNAYEIINN